MAPRLRAILDSTAWGADGHLAQAHELLAWLDASGRI
jgi:hypothetical protein